MKPHANTTIDIRPLSPDLLDDFLHFFDHDAFRDNPQWASCYCQFSVACLADKPWRERTGPENRAAARGLIACGQMQGLLAYAGGQVVGWCHAAPRERFTTLPADPELAGRRVGAIVCFVVANAWRGQGIARQFLTAACKGFSRQGCELIEAYPRTVATSEAANYHGPLGMYLASGFEPVR